LLTPDVPVGERKLESPEKDSGNVVDYSDDSYEMFKQSDRFELDDINDGFVLK
jgi:hypothetical protein